MRGRGGTRARNLLSLAHLASSFLRPPLSSSVSLPLHLPRSLPLHLPLSPYLPPPLSFSLSLSLPVSPPLPPSLLPSPSFSPSPPLSLSRTCEGALLAAIFGGDGRFCLAHPPHPFPVPVQGYLAHKKQYRGASLIRNSALLRPYSRTMPRALW